MHLYCDFIQPTFFHRGLIIGLGTVHKGNRHSTEFLYITWQWNCLQTTKNTKTPGLHLLEDSCAVKYPVCWETRKQLIRTRLGIAQWRQKQLELLDGAWFTSGLRDVSDYLMQIHRGIEYVYPGLGNEDMRIHVQMRSASDLSNIITVAMSAFLALCSQIITGTKD